MQTKGRIHGFLPVALENQDQITDNSSSVIKTDLLEYPADPDGAGNKACSSKTNSHDVQSNKANLLVFLPSPTSPSPSNAVPALKRVQRFKGGPSGSKS